VAEFKVQENPIAYDLYRECNSEVLFTPRCIFHREILIIQYFFINAAVVIIKYCPSQPQIQCYIMQKGNGRQMKKRKENLLSIYKRVGNFII
jgi:hypothetical protein